MSNIQFADHQALTTYRKISIASWKHPRDPQVYASIDLPMEAADAFLDSFSETPKPTLTHYVASILAHCFEKYPQFNHVLRGGSLVQRRDIDVFITTLVKNAGGKDLSGFVIRDVPGIGLKEVARQSTDGVARLRKGDDPDMRSVQRMVRSMPAWLLRIVLRIQDFFQHTLNWDLSWTGIPRDPVGSVIITNIGALGLESAFIPLSPYTRCPVIVGIGKAREAPVVREGDVVVGKVVTITFTFDHRHADGAHGAQVVRRFAKVFANPEGFSQVFEPDSSNETKGIHA